MEDNFNQDEFEEFLKDQVRNQRMYPSDAVWRSINRKLHGDKKWPALTIAAFALIGASIAICAYFFPKPNIFAIQPTFQQNVSQPANKNDNVISNLTASNSTKVKDKTPFLFGNKPKEEAQAGGPLNNVSNRDIALLTNKNDKTVLPIINERSFLQQPDEGSERQYFNLKKPLDSYKTIPSKESFITDTLVSPALVSSKEIRIRKTVPTPEKQVAVKDYNDKNMVDDFLKENQNDVSLFVINKQKSIKNKFNYQVYVAPSVSYRKLREDPSISAGSTAGPVGLNHVTDVNKVVRHKPGNGIEAGVSIMYNLSERLRLKSGLQFNMREYSIEAYRSNTEVASIALIERNRIDTINTMAFYRNNSGYSSTELVNRYYQLAVPIGLEWEVIGNKKIRLSVAGTIQPTYLFNHNAYLLSTNFKNYSENPEMVRTWNINSNIEAFVSFKVGDFKWQIGPQIRYQPYSTFIPQYPIKEHLLDYSFKIGVSKNF